MSASAPRRCRSDARERAAAADDAQLAEDAVRAVERAGRPGPVAVLEQQRAQRVARVLRGLRLVRDEADAAVVGHRDPVAGRSAGADGARVGQAGDGPVGAQQLARVPGDRVEDVAQVAASGELEGHAVQRLALALAAVEVGDGQAELGGARDLAGDVDEGGVGDVGLDGRMEGEAQVAEALAAAHEGEVEHAGVEAGATGVARPVDGRVAGLGEERREPGEAGREGDRPLDREGLAVGGGDRDDARERAGLRHDAVERLLEQVGQRQPAAHRGAHLVGDGEVLVLGDQLALGPVEVDRDDRREHDDRDAHDHRGGDVALVAGELRIEDEEADDLEAPDEDEGQHEGRPSEAVEVAGDAGVAHEPTVPFDTDAGVGPCGPWFAGPSGTQPRAAPRDR